MSALVSSELVEFQPIHGASRGNFLCTLDVVLSEISRFIANLPLSCYGAPRQIVLVGTVALHARGVAIRPAGDVDLLLPRISATSLESAIGPASCNQLTFRQYPGGVFAAETHLSTQEGDSYPIDMDLIGFHQGGIPQSAAIEIAAGSVALGPVQIPLLSDLFALKLIALADRIRNAGPQMRLQKYYLDVTGIMARYGSRIDRQRVDRVLGTFPRCKAVNAIRAWQGLK